MQSVTRCTVYRVAHGGVFEQPSLQVQRLVTVGSGSAQPQCAVTVERMAHGGQVQENGQTVDVVVMVGQTAVPVVIIAWP